MIRSLKGQQLFETVTPIYYQSIVMSSIFQAIGEEFENIDELTEEVLLQLFPQTATWGIVYWEEATHIPINNAVPLEQRRARILSKMQTRWPVTKSRMEAIINNFVSSKNAYIKQLYDQYKFVINIPLTGEKVYYSGLVETVEEVKPAHLAYTVEGIAGENNIITSRKFAYNFLKYLICGTFYPKDDEYWKGHSANRSMTTIFQMYTFDVDYLICGTFETKDTDKGGSLIDKKISAESMCYSFDVVYPICGMFYPEEVD